MIRANILIDKCVAVVIAMLSCHCALAQVGKLVSAGDSLHRIYHFEEALNCFDEALLQIQDTSSRDSALFAAVSYKLLMAENGSNMSQSVHKPEVLGKRMVSLEEFFLFYPLENKSWRKLPNQLDPDTPDSIVRAVYAPGWNNVHYFSKKDENGFRDIYRTEQQDTIWTLPGKVEGLSTETANEIYPVFSPDGKTLYFSSDSRYGIGGYDIYYSTWDDSEGCWSMPQNMGMPFSSPADDFLYVDSEDERYSVFASTRDCPEDSVWVYSIRYERLPVTHSVNDPEELLDLSRLEIRKKKEEVLKSDDSTDGLTSLYMTQMNDYRALKSSIASISSQLEDLRMELTFSNDDSERYELSARILEIEQQVPSLQKDLEYAKEQLHKTQMEFLKKGVFINPDDAGNNLQDDGGVDDFKFTKRSFGDSLKLNMETPLIEFDYSLRILPEALFAEDQTLPQGIIYQIQLFGVSKPASLDQFRGLSPVYESISPSGMYVYRVGRFYTYEEASVNLETVRDLGFVSAFLCAFDNGEEIPVADARDMQESKEEEISLYEISIMPDSGELDPSVEEIIISSVKGKDIIRSESEDGVIIYTVGPFDVKAEADALIKTISEMVSGKVVCEPIIMN